MRAAMRGGMNRDDRRGAEQLTEADFDEMVGMQER